MVGRAKSGITLSLFLLFTFFVACSTMGVEEEPAQKGPDVMIKGQCPSSLEGLAGVSVNPWLIELSEELKGTEGTVTWSLHVNKAGSDEPETGNRIVISAPFGDPDNWPFEKGSYSAHGKISVPYKQFVHGKPGEEFNYTITVECEDPELKIVIDPMVKIAG